MPNGFISTGRDHLIDHGVRSCFIDFQLIAGLAQTRSKKDKDSERHELYAVEAGDGRET